MPARDGRAAVKRPRDGQPRGHPAPPGTSRGRQPGPPGTSRQRQPAPPRPWRLVVTGGGTGGHIYPALAVARRAAERFGPVEVLYVGAAGGLEGELAPAAGLPFVALPVSGMVRKRPVQVLRAAGALGVSLWRAWRLLGRFGPDVVVGTGGYAAGPVGVAAALRGVPLVIQEQNVIPGVTNRFLARFAAGVAVPFAAASSHLPRRTRLWVTGNPVRPEILGADRTEARRQLGLPAVGPVVLMYAGSRGSAVFVRWLAEWLDVWRDGAALLFVSGTAHHGAAVRAAARRPGAAVRVVAYLHDLGQALAAADLVVCRAGGMTVAEIAAVGRPAILVPSPHVTHHHQDGNAEALGSAGAAVVLAEQGLTGSRLAEAVYGLLADPARLAAMERASAAQGRPQALDDLVERVRGVCR